jgi:hypothetical protein
VERVGQHVLRLLRFGAAVTTRKYLPQRDELIVTVSYTVGMWS